MSRDRKLTPDQERQIRRQARDGASERQLADWHDVARVTIGRIIDRAPDDEPTDPPVTDESWRTGAACRGADPDLFFPDRGGHVVAPEAKAICNGCEVRAQCLDYAIATRQEHGIWGGTSLMERRQIRRQRREQVSA